MDTSSAHKDAQKKVKEKGRSSGRVEGTETKLLEERVACVSEATI